MFNNEIFAATLARGVDLMRKSDAKEQQKAALRALVTLAAAGSATVRSYDGILSVDDVQIDAGLPFAGGLSARMAAHNISEIAIGRNAEPAELLALIRGLAEGPYGVAQVKERLRDAKSQKIMVLLSDENPAKKRNSLSLLFEDVQQEAPRVPGAAAKARGPKDDSAEVLEAWDALNSSGNKNSMMQEIDLGFTAEPEAPAAPPPPPPVNDAPAPGIPIPADTPLGMALIRVARRPHDGDILERLTRLAEAAQVAINQGQGGDVMRMLAMVVGLSQGAAEGTPQNSYRITMRRILSRDALLQLAPVIKDPAYADETALVLPHAGAEATDVFLTLLIDADNIKERRAYMNALRAMPQGREQIPRMLTHHQWFVVRNIAELVGEMKLELAIPDLGKLLDHQDPRVRRAAAIALAKIGTPQAMEPVRNALKGAAPDLRALVASLVGSAHAATFGAPLMSQLEIEEDPDALKEICGALARINTPETIQALERTTKQGGMFNRRAKLAREAAEGALKRTSRG
ncbi:MAG TPA: HEAT repeat domain-containing protein [Gemmatimonadales bacterium]|jgi:hypothetical protein